jgi:hypothetical protein
VGNQDEGNMMHFLTLLLVSAILAGCSGSRVPEGGGSSPAHHSTRTGESVVGATRQVQDDLAFVDQNIIYRHDPLFKYDPFERDFLDVAFPLAFGLMEAGAIQHSEKALTPSERFPWEEGIGFDTDHLGSGSLVNPHRTRDSLPYICHLKDQDLLSNRRATSTVNMLDAERIGILLTDLCEHAQGPVSSAELTRLYVPTPSSKTFRSAHR